MNESVLHLRQYPEKEEIAYPKPGTPNPKVRLIVPSVNYLMEWPCFVCVWRNLLMCLVHLIKVGLTVMKLPKGPRVAITPPKELTGQVKICNLPLFFLFQDLVSIFCLAGTPVDQFPLDVGWCAGGQLDEQDPESQHPPQVFFAVLLLNSTSDQCISALFGLVRFPDPLWVGGPDNNWANDCNHISLFFCPFLKSAA